MTTAKRLYVYGGAYATNEDALADLKNISDLHNGGQIGAYDVVALKKEVDGTIRVIDTVATTRGTGAWKAGVAGAVLGVLFPPSVFVTAAAGAAAGALVGDLKRRIDTDDAKRLADLLAPGEAGVLFVGEDVSDAYASALLRHTTRERAIVIDADADIIEAALAEARDS